VRPRPTARGVPARFQRPTDLLDSVGALLGPTGWRHLSQGDVDLFAEATGDDQWIHVDPERAAAGPFGATIAHGYMTLSMAGIFVPQLLEIEHCSAVINYGCDRVRFLSPVRIPAALRGRGTIVSARAVSGGVQVSIEVAIDLQGSSRPACLVTSVLRYLD